ncbi:MAG: group I truncated hemoglobin [Candidatus Binatia bacterium]
MQTQPLPVRIFYLAFTFALILLWCGAPALAQEKPEKSLYERLGGVKPIVLVVDDFIDRLVTNETLNANPKIREGRERSPDPYLKFQVTNLVCQVTGGPCQYTGLPMKDSHQHLNITEAEWRIMLAEFKKSLDKFQVPAKEQDELIVIVESTKKDIVIAAAQKQ